MGDNNEGGRRLRHLRDTRGWTRSGLAERSGVSESSIANYEQGATKPDPSKILPIAEAFGQDGPWILDGFGYVDDARLMAERHAGRSHSEEAFSIVEKMIENMRTQLRDGE